MALEQEFATKHKIETKISPRHSKNIVNFAPKIQLTMYSMCKCEESGKVF